ncbi:hypothetical protein TH53_11125 [Pedobacter lusitanus]|uniref:Uncharacterized protein n=1 Tax=Pedobacter lusitanus TaxID=1503925 RepID=A0A0D0F6C5_9SPHI|nr:hypothetical protein [Pedobacter lusitanus]KIO77178.1 hypothetical protein TH53_11125 [Pedobacter lusitanus]
MNIYAGSKKTKWDIGMAETVFHIRGAIVVTDDLSLPVKTTRRMWVNGIEIFPEQAGVVRPFYECNFEWGELGQNASYTTALSICLAIFKSERLAENLFVCFKEEFVQNFPDGNFELVLEITRFLNKHNNRLHPDLYSRFCFSAITSSREILLYKNPKTGLITANLAENYAMHRETMPNIKLRKLNERKQRLLFRLFAKDNYLITGYEFTEVMSRAEDLMTRFYWRSVEKIITSQIEDKYEE